MRRFCAVLVVVTALSWPSAHAVAAVPWTWPAAGAIVRGFDPPDDPYGGGHRGIDIAAAVGAVVVAPDDGVVTFAGKVGRRLLLPIHHGGASRVRAPGSRASSSTRTTTCRAGRSSRPPGGGTRTCPFHNCTSGSDRTAPTSIRYRSSRRCR